MASKYPNVHYDRETYAKWYSQLGPALPRLMRILVDRERKNVSVHIPIYIEFHGNPSYFSKTTVLNPLCLRKPAEVPNILGKLIGKEETPAGRLIILKASTPKASFWERLVEMMISFHRRFASGLAKNSAA